MIHESPDGGKTIKSREMNLPKGSNNSQTAVELLFDKLWDTPKDKFTWYAILEQAKQLEKQQIIDAFDEGKSDGYKTARDWDEMIIWLSAEQYYNETYGSKGSETKTDNI